ncbi:MAG TPA: GNAT family N-acetyltransferase [Malonomonas sp.]
MRYQPSLQTERLRLRPFIADDAEMLVKLAGTREIADTTISVPHPYTPTAAKSWIVGLPHLYRTGSAIHFVISLLETKQMIGSVALRVIDKNNATAELEVWIGQPWRRQGYAGEALQEMLDFAFRQLELNRLYSYHFSGDRVAEQFLQKQGFELEGVLREAVRKTTDYQDISLSALLAKNYEKNNGVKL